MSKPPSIRITERTSRGSRYLGIRFMGALYEEFGPDPDPDYVIEVAYKLADKYGKPRDQVVVPENLR